MNTCSQCDRGLNRVTKEICLPCKGTGYEQEATASEDTSIGATVEKVARKVIKKVTKKN